MARVSVSRAPDVDDNNNNPLNPASPTSAPPLPVYTADYSTRTPFVGENGVNFNYGSPGSLTETINKNNPTGDPGKPYVDQGDSGGYLWQKGETLGPGTSITAAERDNYLSQARTAGLPESYIAEMLGKNPGDYNRILEGYDNIPGEGSNDNPRAALSSGQPYPYSGNTFSDPWTSQLEQLITKQLNGLTNAQPGSPQAMLSQYLMDRFKELSSAQGYTPSEQAILNTQAFEPIEAQRQASQQRVLERAGSRGILPSSGLVQGEYAKNDRSYDQLRTVADRDLAVNQINRQDQQRGQALSMIQGLNTQEQGVNSQALQLATLLRQLPMDALQQAQGVINGTGNPSNLLQQVSSMVQAQQQNSQNNTNAWLQALGYGLDTLFG